MAEYRLYFFDAAGHIFARHEFAAPDDETAISAGCVAGDASGDMHSGYAIWRADRELFSQETRTPRLVQPLGPATLPSAVQTIVLEMERRLATANGPSPEARPCWRRSRIWSRRSRRASRRPIPATRRRRSAREHLSP